MNHDTQIELIRRVHAHIEAGTTDCAAADHHQPVAGYLEPTRFEAELEALFRRGPVTVGHQAMLPEPGDFITREVAGVPLLLVRQDDGAIAGFINVCRHRGTCVVGDAAGRRRKSFVCPYHGWTYGRDGVLVGIPDRHGFAGVAPGSAGLVRVPVAVRGGLLWVAPSAGGDLGPDLPAPIADDLESFGLAGHHVYAPIRLERQLNWKLVFDVFGESYHLRVTHRDTIYPMFFDNLGLVDAFAPHLRNIFPKRSIRELAAAPPESWCLRQHANVLYLLFPNTILLIEPDHAAVLHVLPLAVDRSVIEAYTLVPEPPDERAAAYWDKNNAILHGAIEEDFAMGASIQRGLASGANRSLHFGRFEHALTHFHGWVAERLPAASAPAAAGPRERRAPPR